MVSTTHPLFLHFVCASVTPPPPLVENVQLSLALQTENKGSVVAGGELNVCLDGMVVDLGSLPNGNTAVESEFRLSNTHMRTVSELKAITQTYCTEEACAHIVAITLTKEEQGH